MTKSDLRVTAKAARAAAFGALTPYARLACAIALAEYVDARLDDAKIVAAYLPIGSEIDARPSIDRCTARGLVVALPHVTRRGARMRFLRWAPGDELVAGPMGLDQPHTDASSVVPDLVLVPLLAFDARLHRLGYGAGHYDHALAALPLARRIGLAWSAQRVEAVPNEAHDVPLDAIATENDWIIR